jgi:hypothetical protein
LASQGQLVDGEYRVTLRKTRMNASWFQVLYPIPIEVKGCLYLIAEIETANGR